MKTFVSIISIIFLSVVFESCDTIKTTYQGELTGVVNINIFKTSVNGQILGELSYPDDIDSIKVVLTNENNGKKYITFTKDGIYKFNDLPDGSFTASIQITDNIRLSSNTKDIIGGGSLNFNPVTFDTYKSNSSNISLEKVYPLPFNEFSINEFKLLSSDTVNEFVYDLKGNLVAELIKGEVLQEGFHSCDFSNKIKTDGIYFIYVETKNGFSYSVGVRKTN
jgi:hypothetical protein